MHARRQPYTQCLLPKLCLQPFPGCLTSSHRLHPSAWQHTWLSWEEWCLRETGGYAQTAAPHWAVITSAFLGFLQGQPQSATQSSAVRAFLAWWGTGPLSSEVKPLAVHSSRKALQESCKVTGRQNGYCFILCELFSFKNWLWSQHPCSVWPWNTCRTYIFCLCCSTLQLTAVVAVQKVLAGK